MQPGLRRGPAELVVTEDPVTSSPARPSGSWWAWVGVHGGAGATTLAAALPGGIEVARRPEREAWDLPLVAVCRTHAAGLRAAQEWASSTPGGAQVLGLVVIPDSKGRLPRKLESMLRLISGGYRHVWRLPWVEEWRQGATPTPENLPTAGKRLLADLVRLTDVLDEEAQK